ncbi:penicillin-binding protein 2 [Propioniciclava sp. MC1595]|uniref:peptidoglycan D,D-transpeptidase FtsI family protein n=1 Tax=Propioniciclava sp. MC1595 TaxID=2760308 RepID=UPI001662459E|nr:penicillin-binding protein 2 [Propioniciclava sp. MC1595]MBB1493681.1 penicillin-binding protein 2 [Propioniciclava sp. MC1595]QTE27066.1 penicillin-binding protein 2 [Propioniciclava sp. MC1595]
MSRPTPRRKPARVSGRARMAATAFRLRVLVLAVAILFSVAAARAVQIQVVSAEAMASEAAQRMTVARDVPAQRGTITGRDGQVLALTEATVNVIADPSMISTNGKEPEAMRESDRAKAAVAPTEMAAIIAAHTGVPAEEVEAKLRTATTSNAKGETVPVKYTILARQVRSSVWVELNAALNEGKYVGVFRESNPKRVYPMGSVASNIVGFMSEGKGRTGLESAQEDALAGTKGREQFETSPNGRIPLGNQTLTPAVDGKDFQLTIDADLQWMVERRLAERVDEVGGNWGVAIVQDVETGELLSLANYPSYDSSKPGDAEPGDTGNRAVTAMYEPGSVQKVLTLASLLDAGLTTPDRTYAIKDTVKVGEHTVRDAFKHGDIDITTRGILVKSSNIGAITAARELEPAQLRDYMAGFGLGQKTTLGLPGEQPGSLPGAGMPQFQADSIAYGYGLSVTSLQMASAISAVANDGVYTAPSIIKATGDHGGPLVPVAAPETHRVVSEEAARATVEMMEQRTLDSEAQLKIPGYRTGTKTGTARLQAATGGYAGQVASIVGVAPVEDPQILVYVLIARPDTLGAGLGMAGPVYRDIMSLALPRYGVQPSNDVDQAKLPLFKE